MAKLFHFSEEPGIKIFHPRPAPSKSYDIEGNMVWAIDEEHSPNFLLPRDCPRVTYFVAPETTAADREKFFGQTYANRIIAVETELRFTPLLWRLREAVIHSTLGFSLIRIRNAAPPPEGMETFYPLPG